MLNKSKYFNNTLFKELQKKNPNISEKETLSGELFGSNDYKYVFEVIGSKYDLAMRQDILLDTLKYIEGFTASALNNVCGRINIEVDSELSQSFMKNKIGQISMSDFENMPFECFSMKLNHFENAESALVYKSDNKLYCHFQNIGEENVSIQIVVDNDRYMAQYTFSSMYYHREIAPISKATQELTESVFSYVITALLYMIQFNKNKEVVIKDMAYSNYKNSVKKHLSKPNVQKKLDKKRNLISLKFGSNTNRYINSNAVRKNKKCTTPFLVSGFYRNQRIGPRDNYTVKKIWVKPFFKCVQENNTDYIDKVYKVS